MDITLLFIFIIVASLFFALMIAFICRMLIEINDTLDALNRQLTECKEEITVPTISSNKKSVEQLENINHKLDVLLPLVNNNINNNIYRR